MVPTTPTSAVTRAAAAGSGTYGAVRRAPTGVVEAARVSVLRGMSVIVSRPVRDALAEQALGPDEQHDDEEDEGPHVGPAAAAELLHAGDVGDVRRGAGFRYPQDEAAEHGSVDVADAAEDGGGEGLEAGLEAHVVSDLAVFEPGGQARDGGEEAADGEGDDDDPVGVDAHQLGGVRVLGGGLHGAAGAAGTDEGGEADHADHGGGDQEDVTALDGDVADVVRGGAELGEVLGVVGAGVPDEDRLLECQGQTDGGDQRGQAWGAAQGPVG